MSVACANKGLLYLTVFSREIIGLHICSDRKKCAIWVSVENKLNSSSRVMVVSDSELVWREEGRSSEKS